MVIDIILPFLTIFLVEIIITLDNFLLKKFLLRNFDKRKIITLTSKYMFIVIKIFITYLLFFLTSDNEFYFNILGFNVSISSIIMILMGSFLIMKTFAEFYTIMHTSGKVYLISFDKEDVQTVVKFDEESEIEQNAIDKDKDNNVNSKELILNLILISILSSIDSAIISLALSDNLTVIFSAIISAQIIRKLFYRKIHSIFFSFLKLIIVVLILNLIIGIIYIMNSLGISTDRNILYFIFIFAFFSEALYYLVIPFKTLIKKYNL